MAANYVSPVDEMAAHFKSIMQRLASLERSVNSGGGGGGAEEVFVGPTDPGSGYDLWYDTDAPTSAARSGLELLYSPFTANLTVTATTAATAQSLINPGSITYDGSPILVELFLPQMVPPGTAGAQILCNLFDVNTDLGFFAQVITPASTAALLTPAYVARRITPTAGAHNYNVRAWVTTGSGTIGAGTGAAGGQSPGFLRVTSV